MLRIRLTKKFLGPLSRCRPHLVLGRKRLLFVSLIYCRVKISPDYKFLSVVPGTANDAETSFAGIIKLVSGISRDVVAELTRYSSQTVHPWRL